MADVASKRRSNCDAIGALDHEIPLAGQRRKLHHCAAWRHGKMVWCMKIAVVAPSCTLDARVGGRARSACRASAATASSWSIRNVSCPTDISPGRTRRGWRRFARSMADLPRRRRVVRSRRLWVEPDRRSRAADLPDAARSKVYIGYSDAGFPARRVRTRRARRRLGADAAGFACAKAARRRLPARSTGWCGAIHRALEPELNGPAMAFNLTVLVEPARDGARARLHRRRSAHRGRQRAPLPDRPDDVPRHRQPERPQVARLRLGRVGDIPFNDPDFGRDEVAIVQEWCARVGHRFWRPRGHRSRRSATGSFRSRDNFG